MRDGPLFLHTADIEFFYHVLPLYRTSPSHKTPVLIYLTYMMLLITVKGVQACECYIITFRANQSIVWSMYAPVPLYLCTKKNPKLIPQHQNSAIPNCAIKFSRSRLHVRLGTNISPAFDSALVLYL